MNLLKEGGTIVVVGLKANQIPSEYMEDQRFKFWFNPGNDAAIARKELPSNCKAIVMTRFISHATFRSLTDQAKRRNITTFPISSPREARHKLDIISGKIPVEPFLIKEDVKAQLATLPPKFEAPELPIKEDPIMKQKRIMGLQAFILKNTDFSLPAGEDSIRLCKLLKERRDIDTTPERIRTAYFHAKRKAVGRIYKTPEPKVEPKFEPKVEAFIQGELTKLLDSAILSLQLMKSEIERLDKLQKENAELKLKLAAIFTALK